MQYSPSFNFRKNHFNKKDVCMVFIDFTKAVYIVDRELLWKLDHYGCLSIFTMTIREFPNGMQATVLFDGDLSEPFPVCHGDKQNCVLAPTLFGLYLVVILETSSGDF